MGNSPLVSYTKLSKNHSGPRKYPVTRITPHCIVGQATAERIGEIFQTNGASCNYGIAKDGRIVLVCDEANRSWCSSSSAAANKADANDDKAITIEVASDNTDPYSFTIQAYDALLDLCTDICSRYGKKKLLWFGDKAKTLAYNPAPDEMVLTVHRWFAKKSCPGNWMYARMGNLADTVTTRLNASASNPAEDASGKTAILGTSVATVDQMRAYIRKVNPNVPRSVLDMIPAYLSEGAAEGVRGDIAFAQSCLETGNFAFAGSAVTLDQNNFCGMGVTSNGVKGNSFRTPQEGIRAQIQHLSAYAGGTLKNAVVDPRYKYVAKGCAKYVEWLGQKENPTGRGWAAGAGYGAKILRILDAVVATKVEKPADPPGNTPSIPFKARVGVKNLNIRTGPGTNYKTTGKFCPPGVYTITEVKAGPGSKAGWGRLKSGAGWVSLDYAKRI